MSYRPAIFVLFDNEDKIAKSAAEAIQDAYCSNRLTVGLSNDELRAVQNGRVMTFGMGAGGQSSDQHGMDATSAYFMGATVGALT